MLVWHSCYLSNITLSDFHTIRKQNAKENSALQACSEIVFRLDFYITHAKKWLSETKAFHFPCVVWSCYWKTLFLSMVGFFVSVLKSAGVALQCGLCGSTHSETPQSRFLSTLQSPLSVFLERQICSLEKRLEFYELYGDGGWSHSDVSHMTLSRAWSKNCLCHEWKSHHIKNKYIKNEEAVGLNVLSDECLWDTGTSLRLSVADNPMNKERYELTPHGLCSPQWGLREQPTC